MEEQNLPIDVQLKKLLDWLINRRTCNRQWHEGVIKIREKIGEAIRDMPEHEKIKQLLSGASINYFHCLQIVDLLKETEKDSKNFFGSYGSQRMKDWQEVVRLYQRDNIYLAEAAQLLSQAVTYEIPGLKKQLSKSLQVQEDCDKKEKDNLRKVKEFRNEFDKSCKQLGIEGVKIRKEIIGLMSELPETYSKIAVDSKKLKKAKDLYYEFLSSTLDQDYFKESQVLPTLSFLIEKGNVTTYEWMHGEPPLAVEEPKMLFDDEVEESHEIDFGDDAVVDFGDDAAIDEVVLDSEDIDWGGLASAEVGTEDNIDWSTNVDHAEIVIEDDGVSGGVARDSEALSLLDNRRTRTMILDELTELQCFLEQRLIELQSAEDGNFTLATNVVKTENFDMLSASITEMTSLVSRLNTGKIHHLQLIRSSPKYVDRMVDSLKLKQALAEKIEASNRAVYERRDVAIREQAEVQKKLDVMKKKTKELQQNIENDISERYKNRPVNIMGGIQSV